MKTVLHKIFFVTFPSIFIFLILLELCLRVGGYIYLHNYEPKMYSKATDYNSGTINILCLGDSFTQGIGTTPQNSYPMQLQKLLYENGVKNINCINGGIGGKTSSLILRELQRNISKYRPSIIIIMTGCNNWWNLQGSSWFVLHESGFWGRISRSLTKLKIYKLIKIGWINFKYSKNTGPVSYNSQVRDARVADRSRFRNIKSKSLDSSFRGSGLYTKGEMNQAVHKMDEALILDKNNYHAYLGLSHIFLYQGKFQLAKEAIWNAIYSINDWDQNNLGLIIERMGLLPEKDEVREELLKLRKYISEKYAENKRRKLFKLIDARLNILRDSGMVSKILEYDLKEILEISRENDIGVVLLTYPEGFSLNESIRKISKIYNIPLVDNEMVFRDMARREDIEYLFVYGRHCNAAGYKIIAENVCYVLFKKMHLAGLERTL